MRRNAEHTINQGVNTISYKFGLISPLQYATANLQENINFHLRQTVDQIGDFCSETAKLIGEAAHNTIDSISDFFNQ